MNTKIENNNCDIPVDCNEMHIKVESPNASFKLFIQMKYLREALKFTAIRHSGKSDDPIPLDPFVLNNSIIIPNITMPPKGDNNNKLSLKLQYDESSILEHESPKLERCVAYNKSMIINSGSDWKKYFKFENRDTGNSPHLKINDSGDLIVLSDTNQTCWISLNEKDTTLTDLYISYRIYLSFTGIENVENNEVVHFYIDPLVKISSKQGPGKNEI